MLIKMPAIDTDRRKKNSYVREVETQEEADALIAQGGVIVTKAELKPEAAEADSVAVEAETPAPKGKGHK